MAKQSRWQSFWQTVWQSLWVDVAHAFLLIVSGAILSMWPEYIRKSLAPGPVPDEGKEVVILFWAVAVTALVLYFGRAHAARKESKNVSKRSKALIRELRSMPPRDFLIHNAKLFDASYIFYWEAINHKGPDSDKLRDLEAGIRQVLRAIVFLASRFERDYREFFGYASNIMLFHHVESLSPAQIERLDTRMAFCEDTACVDKLEAVLDLKPYLSTTLKLKGKCDDSLGSGFALPIPVTESVGAKTRVIPGAPSAAQTRIPAAVRNTKTLHEWCRKEGDFTDLVTTHIRDYFENGNGKEILSFIAIPLFERPRPNGDLLSKEQVMWDQIDSAENEVRPLLAILNIHSNQTGLLSDDNEPLGQFCQTIGPLTVLLVEMLSAWKRLCPETVD